jgi:hypothetical protein
MTSGYEPPLRARDKSLGHELTYKPQRTFKHPKHPPPLKGQKQLLPKAIDKPEPPPDEPETD